MNIYVGGVNGVGKSTILRRATQIDKRLEVIHFASGIMQQLGLAPGSYDQLRDAPQPAKDVATSELVESLVSRRTHQIRLVDSHYMYLIEGKTYPSTRDWIAKFDALVLVTANSGVIWKRIQADEALRDRDLFSANDKLDNEHRELANSITDNQREFEDLVKRYHKDHFILTHNDDDVDRAARKLINFIDTVQA